MGLNQEVIYMGLNQEVIQSNGDFDLQQSSLFFFSLFFFSAYITIQTIE